MKLVNTLMKMECEHKNCSGSTDNPKITCSDCGAKGIVTITIIWETGNVPDEK